jgi:hypothetical protein
MQSDSRAENRNMGYGNHYYIYLRQSESRAENRDRSYGNYYSNI